jgi:hypothetical protein
LPPLYTYFKLFRYIQVAAGLIDIGKMAAYLANGLQPQKVLHNVYFNSASSSSYAVYFSQHDPKLNYVDTHPYLAVTIYIIN